MTWQRRDHGGRVPPPADSPPHGPTPPTARQSGNSDNSDQISQTHTSVNHTSLTQTSSEPNDPASTPILSSSTSGSPSASSGFSPTSQTDFISGALPTTVDFSDPSIPSTDVATPTASSSNSVGNVSVGTIAGAIVGVLFGLVVSLIIGFSIRRRWNRYTAERSFEDEYNIPEDASYASTTTGHDGLVHQMTQNTSSPSLGDGAGIAGRGVMTSRASGRGDNRRGYVEYPNEDNSSSGAYSLQPQVPEAPHSSEAHGSQYLSHHTVDEQQTLVNVGYESLEPQPVAIAPVGSPPRQIPSSRHSTTTLAAADEREGLVYIEEGAYGGIE